jgi:hypothetical protein
MRSAYHIARPRQPPFAASAALEDEAFAKEHRGSPASMRASLDIPLAQNVRDVAAVEASHAWDAFGIRPARSSG